MVKILLVDDTPDRASALKSALDTLDGVEVACALESAVELAARVAEHRPDIVLIETQSPSRDALEQLAAVSASAPRPVVVFSGDAQNDVIRACLRSGVSAYIVDGIAPERLDSIMRVAMERFEADQQLRAELADTRSRLAERKLVDRAKGILMKHRGIAEDEAYAWLRASAMQRGVRIGEAARQVIDAATLLG